MKMLEKTVKLEIKFKSREIIALLDAINHQEKAWKDSEFCKSQDKCEILSPLHELIKVVKEAIIK